MFEIIDDKKRFIKMEPAKHFDNLNRINKEKVGILKDLVSNKIKNQETLNEINSIGSIRPRLYGLPKLH